MRRFDLVAVVALAGLTSVVGCATAPEEEPFESSSAGLISTEQQHARKTRQSTKKMLEAIEATEATDTNEKVIADLTDQINELVDASERLVEAVDREHGAAHTQALHPTRYGSEDGYTPSSVWYEEIAEIARGIKADLDAWQADLLRRDLEEASAIQRQTQLELRKAEENDRANVARLLASIDDVFVDVPKTKTATKGR
ncbi:MAG: hypothetical protein U0270_39375 [Labilithrix sp.]